MAAVEGRIPQVAATYQTMLHVYASLALLSTFLGIDVLSVVTVNVDHPAILLVTVTWTAVLACSRARVHVLRRDMCTQASGAVACCRAVARRWQRRARIAHNAHQRLGVGACMRPALLKCSAAVQDSMCQSLRQPAVVACVSADQGHLPHAAAQRRAHNAPTWNFSTSASRAASCARWSMQLRWLADNRALNSSTWNLLDNVLHSEFPLCS